MAKSKNVVFGAENENENEIRSGFARQTHNDRWRQMYSRNNVLWRDAGRFFSGSIWCYGCT